MSSLSDFQLDGRTSVGAVRMQISNLRAKKKHKKQSIHLQEKNKSEAVRCVVWEQRHLYKCIKEGKMFQTQDALIQCAQNNELTENHLYIFEHLDVNVERNDIVPKYEAILKCGGGSTNNNSTHGKECYIRAQKAHLAQAYNNSGRTCRDKMWSISETDKTPYWVDRYAMCKLSQEASKLRYENGKKKRKKDY